jgi:hypothetical protein
VDEEEAFRNQQPAISQNQNLFTAKDAEDAKESTSSPLMNTDETDFDEAGREDGGGDVEFVPVPGGYGFERVRLRIEPELSGQRRPVQPTVAPEDPAQVHNSSLRDERLPKGPRSASEPLDADTGARSVLQTEPYAVLG